ncbi:putative eukaryotic translation initiation factor 5-2 [Silene latifolia]|uniref:putative eukaryotic translation initiation factor 5-2 n=1 Tax=Silene latifolia TaxID=37657 RepID=UPI003D7889F9
MALQNIGKDNADDAFYRYKMPKMITKIEGRGNGIKTNIVNMVDISKALARPPSYTTKYFGCELGAQSKFDEKTGTSLVNGSHDTAKLAGLLEIFIKKYVQCYGCGNPETEVLITKSQMIQLKCAACGFVSDVDMRDKLTSFILKNPPVVKKSSKDKKAMRKAEKERLKEGEAADEEAKKLKAKSKKSSKEGGLKSTATSTKKKAGSDEDRSPTGSQKDDDEAGIEDEDDDIQWQTDTSMAAAQKRIQEQLSAVTSEMVMLTTEEDSSKPEPKSNGTHPVDPHETRVKDLKAYMATGPTASQLKAHLGSCSGTHQEVVNALMEALFGDVAKGFAKEANKKKNFLVAALAYADGSQWVLLHGFEAFCGKSSSDAVKEIALVLKNLYDSDLLEEEVIVEWYEKGSAGANKSLVLWKHVKPFVEWLQSAESESEED